MIALQLDYQAIERFCRRHPIDRLALFGSVLRDDFNAQSDIDVLVQFTPRAKVGLFDVAGMEIELSEIVGRRVDLRTAQDLSQYFRDETVRSSHVVYERS